MRQPGSVKFETYYKLQKWEDRSFAWKDIQKSFPTEQDALGSAPAGKVRVVMVTDEGRSFGDPVVG